MNREATEGKCVWEDAFKVCNEKYVENICVWKVNDNCKQWRTGCDINYSYGYKIWKNGKKYSKGVVENVWKYW